MKISRSFSKKVQLNQFEPIESFCAVETELENITGEFPQERLEEHSVALDEFCRAEVEKTIAQYLNEKNICKGCGGIQKYGGTGVKGDLCEQCAKDEYYKTKEA